MITIGGGEILDSMPEKHRRSDKRAIETLRILKEGSLDAQIQALLEDGKVWTIERVAARRGIFPGRIEERVHALASQGKARFLNRQVIVSERAFVRASDEVLKMVKRFHQTNPLAEGIGREELKSRLSDGSSSLTLVFFDSVLEQLSADKKIAVAQDVVHEYGRKVTLKADEERIRAQLAERFQNLGLQVDSANEIIDTLKVDRTIARKLIQLMLKENVLVKIGEDMFIDRSIMDKLIADLRAHKSHNPKLGVGEFKNLTGVTRKHAIPLLEYLDRQRVTKRVGDERMIL